MRLLLIFAASILLVFGQNLCYINNISTMLMEWSAYSKYDDDGRNQDESS